MCTLIVLFRVHPEVPLVLALNRDELLSRPTTALFRWPAAEGGFVAGRDEVGGGTWFGVGKRLVAGLTNHRAGTRSPPGASTRGELVVDALRAGDLESFTAALGARDAAAYGPFHLLVSDGERLRVFTNERGALAFIDTEPGVHVLGNFGLDNLADPVVVNVGEAVRALDPAALSVRDLSDRLAQVLARHGQGWPCVHLDGYGTRSSALLCWGGAEPRLRVAEGPSCAAVWRDESALLEALGEGREVGAAKF